MPRPLLFACALLLAACSSNKDDSGDAGPGATETLIGVCPTTFDASAGKYPHGALPTGASCAADTSCTMPIDDCASDFTADPVGPGLEEYDCLCTAGAWACTLAVPSVYTCAEAGAPADAATDAALDATEDAPSDADGGSVDAGADAPMDAADASTDAAGDATLSGGS